MANKQIPDLPSFTPTPIDDLDLFPVRDVSEGRDEKVTFGDVRISIFSAGGTQRLTLTSSAFDSTVPIRGSGGTLANVAIAPNSGDPDNGVNATTADQIDIVTNATIRASVKTTAIDATVPIRGSGGSAGAPSIVPNSADPDTGLHGTGTVDEVGVSCGGTGRAKFTTTTIEPITTGAIALGASAKRWSNVIADQFTLGSVPDVWHTYSGVVLTTNATPTTALTIAIPDNTVVRFEVYAVARGTAGVEHADYYLAFRVRRQGGGAPVLTAGVTSSIVESSAALNVSGTTSSNNALIQVTGLAATNINWDVYFFAFRVS